MGESENQMPRIATGLEAEALYLEEFMKYYVPKGWRGQIHDFDFVPYISNEDIEIILKGEIPVDKKFDRWYVKEAIQEWLKTKNKA